MFQNVANVGFIHDKEKNVDSISGIEYRLKEILKYQNIIIYALTLLLSTLTIKDQIFPFGLAMLAACVGENVPIIGVFISAIIGTCIGGGLDALGNFIITSTIYFMLVLIFRGKIAVDERNEIMKTGGKLFTANILVSLVKCIFGGFLFFDFFMGFISSAIIYVFYKIFVNGLTFIKNINIKNAFTAEELIAATLIIAVASVSLRNINFFSLNISNVIIIFLIMLLGWKYGMMIGAVTGISIGLAVSFVDGTSFIQISMFAISGILSGILNKFGKIGVIIGFILGNTILTYWVRGVSSVILYFREIFIASIGLLLVPNKFKINIEDLIGTTKLISNNGENRLEPSNEEVTNKLKTISDMFNNLINTPNKDEIKENENFVQDFLDNLEEIKNNIFYEEISNEDNGIARDICKVLKQNDIIVDEEVVEVLKQHNNYVVLQDENIKNDLQEIVKIANRTLKVSQINKAKEEERKRSLELVNNSLKDVTKAIDNCAKEISENKKNKYQKKEQEIEYLLKSKNIKIEHCRMKKLKNEKYIIEIRLDYNEPKLREKDIAINIADIISKSIGSKVAFQRERKDDENKEYSQIYASEDKYVLQVGSSKVTKDGSSVSGDCSLQIKLADGKYLLAIADGMGSGEKARESSKLTLRLIKQMLSAGFNNEESVKMINSRMNLVTNKDSYSSLDVTILDLYAGKTEILKNGACSTYIKNKKNIRKIEAKNLPVGIVDNIELNSSIVELNDGDIFVMCSDGILESRDDTKAEWIEEFLRNVSTNNVQKLADLILAEAIDNSFGIAHDDMTVIVSKVVKRK